MNTFIKASRITNCLNFYISDIICFYAAKGKWPYVPGFMKYRVDNAARSFFNQNDSFIKQFCTKWIQVKECFRPLFGGLQLIMEFRHRLTYLSTSFQTNQITQMLKWKRSMQKFRDSVVIVTNCCSQRSHLYRSSTSTKTTLETSVRKRFWIPLSFLRVSCHRPLKNTSARIAFAGA